MYTPLTPVLLFQSGVKWVKVCFHEDNDTPLKFEQDKKLK